MGKNDMNAFMAGKLKADPIVSKSKQSGKKG